MAEHNFTIVSAPDPWRPIGGGEWVGTDASERFPIYTRGNAGEVYPFVYRPLSFSIAQHAGERAMRRAILRSGLIRPEELDDIPLSTGVGSGIFGGYAYLNLSIQRLIGARVPGGSALDADASFLGTGEPPPHVPLPGERNRKASLAGLRYIWQLTGRTEIPQLDQDALDIDRYLASLGPIGLATDRELSDSSAGELIERFTGWFETHLVVSFGAGALMSMLTQLCEKQFGDATIATRLMSGLGDVDSAAPSRAMWKLGRLIAANPSIAGIFDAGIPGIWDRLREAAADDDAVGEFVEVFGQFVAEFGSRGPNEWDTAFDTWETEPELALTLIDRMRLTDESHAPDAQHDRLVAERRTLEAQVMTDLKWPLRRFFTRVLRSARLHVQSRERAKTNIVKAIHGSRLRAQELDRRMIERSGGERGDLWYLVAEELDGYIADPGSYAATIGQRRELHDRLAERIPPFYFEGQIPPLKEWELRSATREQVKVGEVITGLAGCAGVARGRARIVIDPGDPRGLEPGDVLVAPRTDPSWTPLFVPADAVIVDVGAPMSHAVIVSRELGIPCAISVLDATRRIPDGAIVEVDGGAGTVTIIEMPDGS
jgi:phosphohistidine swiveling domain-containing protein